MGPIALFDKSFLQSLTVDESVWFGHYFMPVICPLFYVETLADLEKAVREGRTPEQEVGIIAEKFPELSAVPNMFHATLALQELLGHSVTMDGRPIRPGGRMVERNGKRGIVYDESPEANAFSRWQRGKFLEIERGMAKQWRAQLGALDLKGVAKNLRDIGIDATTCRSLGEARAMADAVVTGREKHFARMALAASIIGIPREYEEAIIERWKILGYRPLSEYAPYLAHVVSVELFFQFALAAHLIGTERSSNRVDIAYLNYLPFCMMFVSGDDLHRRCAPHFLRVDQEFVWAPDLKQDLRRINEHFLALPDDVKERGIMAIAGKAPNLERSLVRRLRARFMRAGYDDEDSGESAQRNASKDADLVQEMREWTKAPRVPDEMLSAGDFDPQMMAIQRWVRRKKGSWWQVPKDLPDEPED